MFVLLIIIGVIWTFTFLIFSPYWLTLVSFLPLFIFGCLHTIGAYQPLYLIALIPLLVTDIQTLAERWEFKGVWRYASWLPVVGLFAVFAVNFHYLAVKGDTFSNIWTFLVGAAVTVLLGKIWIATPLFLFLNRLWITRRDIVTYKVVSLDVKKSGKFFSYAMICNDTARIELSGFVYTYLKRKGLDNGGTVTFKFKTGWMGVGFSTGFPAVN